MNWQIDGASLHVSDEEDAPVVGDGVVAAEQVLQSRGVGAFRVSAALRLLKLLRVAEQDDISGGLRHGENVGERDLAGLVDEKNVERARIVLARPEPGRPGADLRTSPGKGVRAQCRCRSTSLDPGHFRPLLADLSNARERHALNGGGLHRILEELPDDLVTDGRNADLQAAPDAFDDHAGAPVGLPGSRRALNREDRTIEIDDGSHRERQGVLTVATPEAPFLHARRAGNEKVASDARVLATRDTVRDHILREAHEGAGDHARSHVGMHERCVRMIVDPVLPLLDLHPPCAVVDVADGAERFPVVREQIVALAGLELLRRERVAVNRDSRRGPSEAFG